MTEKAKRGQAVKSPLKDKSNQTAKSHTFNSRRGGWYFCPQSQESMRRAKILSNMMSALNGSNDGEIILVTPGAPKLGKMTVRRPKKG